MSFALSVYFKQKTAYEMRISDWSSDVCSSDLAGNLLEGVLRARRYRAPPASELFPLHRAVGRGRCRLHDRERAPRGRRLRRLDGGPRLRHGPPARSEERL